ncbi:hypothetical protein BCR43DRAFT_509866 [Syncephalastrum racemosum]|uniref:Uncharacterized protein n=1 Tax=Syncephalastrum racemosum TaxID=13706 RepID=A0A1X2HT77_SYNRA|nr:hypothetical protein BCR43DRAFT_509866 [Syncephalastrum racemosum]
MINTDADVCRSLLSHYKDLPSGADLVELDYQLKMMATVPAGWPEHNSLGAYIFASVFCVPPHTGRGIMPSQESLLSAEDAAKEHQRVQEAVQAYRERMERLFGANIIARGPKEAIITEGFDLYDGLGYKRPSLDSPESLQPAKTKQACFFEKFYQSCDYKACQNATDDEEEKSAVKFILLDIGVRPVHHKEDIKLKTARTS